MDRLLAGTPLHSDGKLTVKSLAAEARVKRHVLTHKHLDLKDLFYARVKAQHARPASTGHLHEENQRLRDQLAAVRAERDQFATDVDALTRQLHALTLENQLRHPLPLNGNVRQLRPEASEMRASSAPAAAPPKPGT
jgi:hypothetical protein